MKIKEKEKTSDFGQGLVYCLGLFLAHAEKSMYGNEKAEQEVEKRFKKFGKVEGYSYMADMWFNCASDHLYELQIPENLPEDLKKRLGVLQSKAIHYGHGFANDGTKKEKEWAIEEAKELLRLIDEYFKIKTKEATWK
jgi:hypothetical protein